MSTSLFIYLLNINFSAAGISLNKEKGRFRNNKRQKENYEIQKECPKAVKKGFVQENATFVQMVNQPIEHQFNVWLKIISY